MGIKTPFVALNKKHPDRYRFLLWMKFLIVNAFFSAVFVVAFLAGWVHKIFAKDPKIEWLNTLLTFDVQTSYVTLIAGVFLVGFFLSIQKAFLTSREINNLKQKSPPEFSRVAEYLEQVRGADSGSRAISLGLLWESWSSRLVIIQYLSEKLMLLGLIGTVIGFVIAFSGVRPDLAGDVSAIGGMMATLIDGISLALYTTVAGSILGGLWLDANCHVLQGGSVDFLKLLGDRGEKDEKEARVSAPGFVSEQREE